MRRLEPEPLMGRYVRYTAEEIGYIRAHYVELGPARIASQLGRDANSVSGTAFRLGLRRSSRKSRPTGIQVKEMRLRREEGHSLRAIAKEYGVTHVTVMRHCRDIIPQRLN